MTAASVVTLRDLETYLRERKLTARIYPEDGGYRVVLLRHLEPRSEGHGATISEALCAANEDAHDA